MIELIVVMAIIGILASVSIPSVTGYINRAQEEVCRTNRLTLQRYYQYVKILYPDATLDDILAGNYDNVIGTTSMIKCPADGTYSIQDGHVVCSIHGGGEDDEIDAGTGGEGGPTPTEAPGGPAPYDPGGNYDVGDVLFTDPNGHTVYLSSDWNAAKQYAASNYGKLLTDGDVYQDESGIYVVVRAPYVSQSDGANDIPLSSMSGLQQISPTATILTQSDNTGTVWTTPPQVGDLYYYEGDIYVCGYSSGQYTVTDPTNNGVWIKLNGQPHG